MSEQLDITSDLAMRKPYTMREQALANVLAGFCYPARGSFERLTKPQQRRCLEAARTALDYAAEH